MIRRVLIAGTLVAAGAAPLFLASPANAIPICKAGYTCSYTYYATVARTPPAIGGSYIPCSGTGSSWGKTSGYFDFTSAECG